MAAAFRLLLLIAVFCCGLHVAEPVQAHTEAAHHLAHAADHDHDGEGKSADAAHAVHHHCPVAPDLTLKPAGAEPLAAGVPVFARPVASLASLARAPPLEPPAA